MNRSDLRVFGAYALIVPLIFVAGCAQKAIKGKEFPLMYTEQPRTILIMPPMNESTAAEAKEYYGTTVQESLSYWGFYTYPFEITSDILKMEGIYDSELVRNMPMEKFREYFGADAVLFTTIKKWNKSYMILTSNLTISIDAELKSTITNQSLWKYNGTVVVDLSGSDAGQAGLAGLIVKLVMTAVVTAATDYVPYARKANLVMFSSLPFGNYHPLYLKDENMEFSDQTPDKKKE